MENKMFCYQCEQAAKGIGCDSFGVCGKDPITSAMQDLLVWQCMGISSYVRKIGRKKIKDIEKIDKFVVEALFTTVTNVNFDAETIKNMIMEGQKIKEDLKDKYKINEKNLSKAALWKPSEKTSELIDFARKISIKENIKNYGETIEGLRELLLYGLKGMAAYADHAMLGGKTDENVFEFFYEALDYLSSDKFTVDELFKMNMRCGEVNLRVMELLDLANTDAFGHPVPTDVLITPVKGKAILVSGHELKDLYELLKQTEGKGINIYTHGEMLPAHGYPELKKFKHLVGNYGGAWQDQQKEFEKFPGAIVMTTNCIQKPLDSYKHRIFTTGLVRWPGVRHIADKDFSPVIETALNEKGFPRSSKPKTIKVGFARNAVLSIADKILDYINKGKIKHFFLIGGCDGAKPGRNYYTQFAESVPKDSLILTLACGKFRFNKMEFGEIEGIPRLLDIGQCNDAYSAIQIALALSKALKKPVNELPISFILSWYEQKAVCILLTLLYLGIKNIRLGPTLPAFISKDALNVLSEKFNLMPIKNVEEDLKLAVSKI